MATTNTNPFSPTPFSTGAPSFGTKSTVKSPCLKGRWWPLFWDHAETSPKPDIRRGVPRPEDSGRGQPIRRIIATPKKRRQPPDP